MAFLGSWSLQLRNDTKMSTQLIVFFFIVTSIVQALPRLILTMLKKERQCSEVFVNQGVTWRGFCAEQRIGASFFLLILLFGKHELTTLIFDLNMV